MPLPYFIAFLYANHIYFSFCHGYFCVDQNQIRDAYYLLHGINNILYLNGEIFDYFMLMNIINMICKIINFSNLSASIHFS
jgi:hypothetical protein